MCRILEIYFLDHFADIKLSLPPAARGTLFEKTVPPGPVKHPQKLELSFASLRNWNDGMLEYWNNGMAPFGQINACGVVREDRWFCRHTLTNHSMKCYYFIIPPFHYSIIPVWNMQNGWLGIPYYQQFVEIPIHNFIRLRVKLDIMRNYYV
jgi:hypothetical protein